MEKRASLLSNITQKPTNKQHFKNRLSWLISFWALALKIAGLSVSIALESQSQHLQEIYCECPKHKSSWYNLSDLKYEESTATKTSAALLVFGMNTHWVQWVCG